MVTNLNEVKSTAKALLLAVSLEGITGINILTNHPFTDSVVVPIFENGKIIDLKNITQDKEAYDLWKNEWFDRIDNAKKVMDVYIYIRDPWKLTFLKYAKDFINERKFSELFSDAWVCSENPNMDANCSLEELVVWFKESRKESLMTEEDFEVWKALPNEFVVYRGVGKNRNPMGLSWTRRYDKAKWFANRWNAKGENAGFVQKATIKKENALAYFNTRNEDEIVVDVFAIGDKIDIIK